jgi:hypothetical protein
VDDPGQMFRRVVSTLLIVGWISLSGFDVVEDLDEVPGQTQLSKTADDAANGSKRGGWGPLANNIIESASRIKQVTVETVVFTPTIFRHESPPIIQKHSQLHKLFRVFLI